MELLHQILFAVCVFCTRKTDSLVVTKFDSDSIVAYFNHVRAFESADEAVEEFFRQNLTRYCHALRKSASFEPVKVPIDDHDDVEIIPTYHRIPENLFETERTQKVQIRKFRLNTNQTLIFRSFQCLNLHGEPLWFITSALVPDSAFLLEVEPRYSHLVTRKIDGNNEIPARLIGIIDKDGNRTASNTSNWYENSNTDPLCELDPILQHRICVIVADTVQMRLPPATVSENRGLSRTYQDQSSNFYYQSAEYEERCAYPHKLSKSKLLHCLVKTLENGTSDFFLALNLSPEPFEVFKFTYIFPFNSIFTIWDRYRIPLLTHLEIYKKVGLASN